MKKSAVVFLLAISLILSVACISNKKPQTKESESVPVKVEKFAEAKRVDIMIGEVLFTSFRYADSLEKPFLFPIVAADGITVTRGFPIAPREGEGVDHPHHTGFWFNYGNVNGINFWGNSKWLPAAEKVNCGIIRVKNIEKSESQSDKGILTVNNEWVGPDGSIPLAETATYVFQGGKDYRIIDHITTLTALVPEVVFTDTKEGAFAIRVARFLEFPSKVAQVFVDAQGQVTKIPVMNNEGVNGNYLSSEGVEGAGVWSTRAKWMELYGISGSDTVSIVFMDHPANPNYPTFWHARDYGLFSANPFGQKDFTQGKEEFNFRLKKGESVTFKHRLYIKSGQGMERPEIEAAWQKFSEEAK
jgi:hypothetical protein